MKIDKDGHYKTVDGRRVRVTIERDEIRGNVVGESGSGLIYTQLGQRYNPDGTVYDMVKGEELDAIISEWTDTPEVGTLQEIGAKVGDVVECLSCNNGPEWIGHILTIDKRGFAVNDEIDAFTPELDKEYNRTYRIISRAQPKPEQTGPVRTVTRKEIVPGVYGTLQVHACGDYTINESTADELTAAIAALTAIRDALKENGK